MSTRANIILRDGSDELFFYRHSDGYPDGALPTLKEFMGYIAAGTIRNNLGQCAGWLILIGAREYQEYNLPDVTVPVQWKCGSIEPTTGIHGDIQYLYVLDIGRLTISVKTPYWNKDGYFMESLSPVIDTIEFSRGA
jgi:hypothetical protein